MMMALWDVRSSLHELGMVAVGVFWEDPGVEVGCSGGLRIKKSSRGS